MILLHVIDPSLIEFAAAHELGSRQDVAARMRERAERELANYKVRAADRVDIETIICEGAPFLEILRKAEDFAVDVIVMGKVGSRGPVEKLLFGSTAERVLRGNRCPVLVLPADEERP